MSKDDFKLWQTVKLSYLAKGVFLSKFHYHSRVYLCVKSHPGKVEPKLDPEVFLDQPEWLLPVPVPPLGPLQVQDLLGKGGK